MTMMSPITLLSLFLLLVTANAFLSPFTIQQYSQRKGSFHSAQTADDNDDEVPPQQPKQQPDPVEAFMEEASRKGADKVKAMSIEERTRRAMLAEAVEDRIFSLYDDLEQLLDDTKGKDTPTSVEDREEITSIAKQIKASQSQYENLVSGQPSAMLDLGTNNGDEE